jgi:hypothetical protein
MPCSEYADLLSGPLQSGEGISGGIVLRKNFDGVDLFRASISTRFAASLGKPDA